jgi:hypothetical protein
MREFPRIQRLPPYVFSITAQLKMAARRRGEDIIDMSMGNPDGPTPQHITDKLVEAALRENTHGYSVSQGIPRLRKAICDWYQRRYDVSLDPETEAVVTIGSKEGIAHLMLATVDRGDTVLVPESLVPDSHLWCDHRRRRHPLGADDAGRRLFRGAAARSHRDDTETKNDDSRFPEQSHGPLCRP